MVDGSRAQAVNLTRGVLVGGERGSQGQSQGWAGGGSGGLQATARQQLAEMLYDFHEFTSGRCRCDCSLSFDRIAEGILRCGAF
jgi:hypothetical protein